MEYIDAVECNQVTATRREQCQHLNGWIVRIPIWWIFNVRVFVCSDCGSVKSISNKE